MNNFFGEVFDATNSLFSVPQVYNDDSVSVNANISINEDSCMPPTSFSHLIQHSRCATQAEDVDSSVSDSFINGSDIDKSFQVTSFIATTTPNTQ